ncbi:MAG: isoprenoid biosynthesis glyoxalase ElbB [Bdellovibrionales bacterium]
MKKIAVVLSGCGHKDGTEITEAVSALIGLAEFGAQVRIFAPNLDFRVATAVGHGLGKTNEFRNALVESARIARGDIQDIKELRPEDFDGVVFPGGFGAAVNLCSWAQTGATCEVHPEAERVIRGFFSQGKPIGALCIAPALVARVLGDKGITVTIGKNDNVTTAEIAKTGANHEDCAVDDFISDRDHKIVTSPAYMFGDANPYQVFTGVRKAMKELVEMA